MKNRIMHSRTLRDSDNENALQWYIETERAKRDNPVCRQLEALALDSAIAALPHAAAVLYLVWSEHAESLTRAMMHIHDNIILNSVFLGLFALLFIFKDITGRSLGNRISKLHIVTTDGSQTIPIGKLIVRNLLFFLIPVDVLVLIFTGRRLLDRPLKIDVMPISK